MQTNCVKSQEGYCGVPGQNADSNKWIQLYCKYLTKAHWRGWEKIEADLNDFGQWHFLTETIKIKSKHWTFFKKVGGGYKNQPKNLWPILLLVTKALSVHAALWWEKCLPRGALHFKQRDYVGKSWPCLWPRAITPFYRWASQDRRGG